MLKSFLKIAWRHLKKSKLYSLINIAGLAIGMAVAMLIGLWISDEISFDHYHQLHKELAQVYDTQTWNGETNTDCEIDIPLENELKSLYPQDFQRMALISPGESGHLLVVKDKNIAILISCLGLFGLASFVAEQRTKEIGIRKVLGATVFDLWLLLSKEFVALVMLSFLIASPIAAYYLVLWLRGYEYRTPISWWIFAAAGIGALLITLFTVSTQSIKAARMNPVRSLRVE